MFTVCRFVMSAGWAVTTLTMSLTLGWKCYICRIRAACFTSGMWNLFRFKRPGRRGIWKSSHINITEVTEYLAHRETDIWGDSTSLHIFWRLLYIYFMHISLYVVQKVVVQTLEVTGSQVWYIWGSKNLVTSRIASKMRYLCSPTGGGNRG